jgi:hypothetical protein
MMPDLPQDIRAHHDWLLSLAPVPEVGVWADLGCGVGGDVLTVAAWHRQPQLRIVGWMLALRTLS